jgi:MFS family permease
VNIKITTAAIIIAGIITAFYGRYYDKVGFVGAILPSLICLALGYVVLIFFTHVVPVFIGSLLMMSGYLTGMAVFGAMIRDCTPVTKAGALQGLRIVGQVLIPGVIGPAIGAWVLTGADVIVGGDGVTQFIPNQNIFIAALVVCVITLLAVLLIGAKINKDKKSKQQASEQVDG